MGPHCVHMSNVPALHMCFRIYLCISPYRHPTLIPTFLSNITIWCWNVLFSCYSLAMPCLSFSRTSHIHGINRGGPWPALSNIHRRYVAFCGVVLGWYTVTGTLTLVCDVVYPSVHACPFLLYFFLFVLNGNCSSVTFYHWRPTPLQAWTTLRHQGVNQKGLTPEALRFN